MGLCQLLDTVRQLVGFRDAEVGLERPAGSGGDAGDHAAEVDGHAVRLAVLEGGDEALAGFHGCLRMRVHRWYG